MIIAVFSHAFDFRLAERITGNEIIPGYLIKIRKHIVEKN